MRGRLALILAVIASAMWLGTSALAADQTVNTTADNMFSPSEVTINVGETVTWHNQAMGDHNVALDNGSFRNGDPSVAPWTAHFTFNTAGTFGFHCEVHGASGGVGMSGKVIVQGAGGGGGGGGGGAGGGDTTAPTISSLKAKPSKLCNKKSKQCKKTGTKVTFTLSEGASVTADVTPSKGGKTKTVFSGQKPAGADSFKLSGKGLKKGKYVLRLNAKDAAGNAATPRTIQIRVAKKR